MAKRLKEISKRNRQQMNKVEKNFENENFGFVRLSKKIWRDEDSTIFNEIVKNNTFMVSIHMKDDAYSWLNYILKWNLKGRWRRGGPPETGPNKYKKV